LSRGRHRFEISLAGADLHPGSGGTPGAIGPLVLSRADAARSRVVSLAATRGRALCGRAWDWIEVVADQP
jgi:hypothetical protein